MNRMSGGIRTWRMQTLEILPIGWSAKALISQGMVSFEVGVFF